MLPSLRGFTASEPFDGAFSHLLTDRHNFPNLVRCELARQSRFQFTLSADSAESECSYGEAQALQCNSHINVPRRNCPLSHQCRPLL
jgi:hypothetical protein